MPASDPDTTEPPKAPTSPKVSQWPLPDDTTCYQRISPYNPEVYKCTGYLEEVYGYFDGSPGPDKDQRFTIDIEHGTTDRLRDVRPYLYYIGLWSSPQTTSQPDLERGKPSDVEDDYFLRERDWGSMNEGVYERFPFAQMVHSDEEGDVGCESGHEIDDFPQDCCGRVLITNIRTSLPELCYVRTRPDHPDWDLFIQWIYDPSNHGIMFMVGHQWCGFDVERERIRACLGSWAKWVVDEGDENGYRSYPTSGIR